MSRVVPGRLEIEGFMPFDKVSLDLGRRGLVHIDGDNRDSAVAASNRSGKSSIAEAILWCLTGSLIRGYESVTDVVNIRLDRGCMVSLELIADTDTYKITRSRGHKELGTGLTLLMNNSDLTGNSSSITQDSIYSILGMSAEQLLATTFLGQAQTELVGSMSPKSRLELVESIVGSPEMRSTQLVVSSRYSESRRQFERDSELVSNSNAVVLSTESNLVGMDKRIAERKINRDREVGYLEEELVACRKEVEFKNESVEVVNKRLGELASSDDARAHSELSSINGDIRSLEATRSAVAKETTTLSRQRENLEGGTCSSCEIVYNDSMPGIFKAKKDLDEKLFELHSKSKSIEEGLADLETKSVGLKETADKYSQDLAEANQFKMEAIANLHKSRGRVSEIEARLESVRTSGHEMASERDLLFSKYLDELEELSDNLDALQHSTIDYKYWEVINKIVGSPQFRAAVIAPKIAYINARASEYQNEIAGGDVKSRMVRSETGRLKGKVDISVDTGGRKLTMSSGSEHAVVNVSSHLAMADFLYDRTDRSFELLVLDEITDGFDPSGVSSLIDIVERKVDQRGTILLISHHPVVKSRTSFDARLLVTKENGVSTVGTA